MVGDESYAGARSYFKLKNTIKEIFDFDYFLPTHQGRAAENVLFSALIKEGDIIPGNTHFDTTKGHIESRQAKPVDCTINEAFDTQIEHPFKGNVDIEKLQNTINEHGADKIPFIIITVTCNSAGGQPVSMENIRKVKKIAEKHGIPLYFDAARFAENAYFIKEREKEFKNKTIKEIVKEMFSYVKEFMIRQKFIILCMKDILLMVEWPKTFLSLRPMSPPIFTIPSFFELMED